MAEYKKWLELSDEEKEALRKRWTTGKESDSSLLAKLEESVPQRKEIKAFLALSCKDSKDLEDNLRKIFKEVGIKIVSGCQTMGSENLFSWVSTRMKGCSIGIVIYNALNRPNITFEYGMMIGMEEKIKHIIVLADNNFRDELERFGSPFSDVIAPCRPRFFRLQELKTGTSGAIAEFKEKIWGDIWFVICEFYDLPKDDDEKCNEYKEYWLGKKTGKGIKDLQIRALTYRSEGDRFSGSKDYHNAIRSYREALKIFTLKDFPQDYAMTQNNLGLAYSNLPTGDRAENLKKAIQCYEEALRVYTPKSFPYENQLVQKNLERARKVSEELL